MSMRLEQRGTLADVFRTDALDGQINQPKTDLASMTLASALKKYFMPITYRQVRDYLKGLVSGTKFLSLYRHYFPEEFEKTSSRKTLEADELFSPAELEFFQLVDRHLFPINEWALDCMVEEMEELEEDRFSGRSMQIPVQELGLSDWYEANIADFRRGWQVLMLAAGITSYATNRATFGGYVPDVEPLDPEIVAIAESIGFVGQSYYSGMLSNGELDEALLQIRAEGLGEPMCYLPRALAVLTHSTGYFFLDAFPDAPIEAWWEIDEMDWLIEGYKEASAYYEPVNGLLTWMEQSQENMLAALELIKSCMESVTRARIRAGG